MGDSVHVPVDEIVYLTLGDADFSFSLDLARYLLQQQQQSTDKSGDQSRSVRVIATGIDSLVALSDKYRDFPFIQKQLDRLSRQGRVRVADRIHVVGKKQRRHFFSVSLHHQVNAVVPPDYRLTKIQAGDHVIFNHPHLGVEDAKLHSRFLCHLFESISRVWLGKPRHNNSTTIPAFHLTLAKGQYERWHCLIAAERRGFRLVDRSDFLPPPVENSYYLSRRHQTGKSFATRAGASEIFTFVRIEDDSLDISIPSQQSVVLDWYQAVAKKPTSTFANQKKAETQQPEFKCPHCDKVFGETRSVRNHILSKHSSDNRKRKRETETFPCEFCCKVCESTQALHDHVQAKHKGIHTTIHPDSAMSAAENSLEALSSTTTYCDRCDICLFEFRDEAAKAKHLDEFVPLDHRCAKTFECFFCGKVFHQDRARLQHENFCTSNKEK